MEKTTMIRILVVDDDPLVRQLLTYQLGGAGYDVCTARNGHDALERLLYEQPDLMLLDVVMPGMSGWDVCNHIRTWSRIPIIMLTAKNADSDVVMGFSSGADDYMCKPFSQKQLLARIEAILRRSYQTTAHCIETGNYERPSLSVQADYTLVSGPLPIHPSTYPTPAAHSPILLPSVITPSRTATNQKGASSFDLMPLFLTITIASIVLVFIFLLILPLT
jgi:DNA-binding response OmpR family regulator